MTKSTTRSRTSPDQPTGYVILNSRVTSGLDAAPIDPAAKSTAAHNAIGLGRPWRPYSRVVYIGTELPAEVNPAGWNNWGKTANETTAYYAESGSTGLGASPTTRVPWSHQLTPTEAAKFLPAVFLAGPDHWNPVTEAARIP